MTNKVNALATAQPKNPRFGSGTKVRKVETKFDLTGANSDAGDILEIASGLSLADRVSKLYGNEAGLPALTGVTDADLGFYYKDGAGNYKELGASKDILWDGVSLVAASTDLNALLAKNGALDESLNIGGLLGVGVDREPHGGLFLCLTLNTANTATETLRIAVEIDEATTV